MPDHGPVEPVLGHDAAPAPRLRGLALLGAPVLEPNLNEKTVQFSSVDIFLNENYLQYTNNTYLYITCDNHSRIL